MKRLSDRRLVLCLLVLASLASLSLLWTPRAFSAEGPGVVAVWDLEDLTPGADRSEVGELLAAQVVEALKEKGIPVVERERLVRTMEELRLGSSPLADESTRLQVGKMVGARRMIFGGYMVLGGRMRIDLRMVEVESGRVVKAVEKVAAAGGIEQWMQVARSAAAEF